MSQAIRVNAIVEGRTEEAFVGKLVSPFLANFGVYVNGRSVQTGQHRGRTYRGGMTTFEKAKADIERWLRQDRSAYVTTMFDLYALPSDFPGMTQVSTTDPYEKAKFLERSLAAAIGNPRFLPYIQLHEFEGLLFSDVEAIHSVMELDNPRSQLRRLRAVRREFKSPEHINDGKHTAPSKRLEDWYPGYQKTLHGILIAEEIGLDRMRRECVHFNEWLSTLEVLEPL